MRGFFLTLHGISLCLFAVLLITGFAMNSPTMGLIFGVAFSRLTDPLVLALGVLAGALPIRAWQGFAVLIVFGGLMQLLTEINRTMADTLDWIVLAFVGKLLAMMAWASVASIVRAIIEARSTPQPPAPHQDAPRSS